MKTIHRTFYYHKFDEKKNEIVCDKEEVAERSMTEEEQKQYKKKSAFVWFWKILLFVSFTVFLATIIICYITSYKWLVAISIPVSVIIGVSLSLAIAVSD